MTLLDPRLWLALLLALGAAYGTGRWQQWRADERAHVAAVAEHAEEARRIEHQLQEKADGIRLEAAARERRLAADLRRARAELRDRPDRLPETARAACAGSTGAELSGRDADFLVGLAARADEQRAALEACQAWAEAVTVGR